MAPWLRPPTHICVETPGIDITNHLENLRGNVDRVAGEDVALRVGQLRPLLQRLEEPGLEVVVDGLWGGGVVMVGVGMGVSRLLCWVG